ncbi:DUF3857 domain-containing transglutaminase family protein [Agarivorans sp. Z349TD_8]|uniref:DUF3857 domain-containing transglutaminase family protein n=1 Tax=Agarivorans sp. Z349TD_8 TaxID=3421434 RepID=UPI003D7CB13C
MKIVQNKISLQLLLCLLLIFCAMSEADDHIPTAPKPNWVSEIALPDPELIQNNQIQNGVYYLLADTQLKVEEQQSQFYYHYADYIVNQTGVENNSQINIDFDPSYQQLRLHSVQVIRDQQPINKRNSALIKLLQREEELEKLVYQGEMTLNIILDDIRVGDIIEYSYSIQGMNPAYQNIFAYQRLLNWSVPLAKFSLRILWNKATLLYYQLQNTEQEVIENQTVHGTEYLIQKNWIEALKIEDNTPIGFDPRAKVYFSELQSWAEVARWSEPFYRDAMIADQHIKNLVSDIQTHHHDREAQISAALRFVQDEIRYFAIELNQNSHIPTPAFETLRNRYGDCKDKTVLLLTLFKELGFKAYPALVNTEDKLDSILPNVQAFDHVITYLEYKGRRYWLDPTRSFQHGHIDNIYQADFGKALVLLKDHQQLTQMQVSQAKHGILVHDHFILADEGPSQFLSTTQDIGKDAERQRQRLAENSLEQIQQDYLKFFQGYYPKTSVSQAIRYTDDTELNILRSDEQYQIENFWQNDSEQQRTQADFYANLVSSSLQVPDDLSRIDPLYLSYPHRVEQTIDIDLTDGDWNFDNESFVEDNPFFHFSHQVKFNKTKQQLSLIYQYQSKLDHISPEDYSAYRKAIQKTQDHLSYSIIQSHSSAADGNSTLAWLMQYLTATTVLMVYGALYLLVMLLWLMERKHTADQTEALFFPVSIVKLALMWVLSFGLYAVYWFYQNFQYIKQQEQNASMPWARACFSIFWYYPLWRKLKTDNEQRFTQSHLPNKWLAILLALIYSASGFIINTDYWQLLSLLLSVALVIPLANYILFINGPDSAAMLRNSKWRFRHYLLTILTAPLFMFQVSSSFGVIPSDTVVKGTWLLDHDIKTMQRQGIIKPGDQIDYFYSDALFFVGNDGNGFTQRHVFSYWKDDEQRINKQLASYSEIRQIKVDWAKTVNKNSTVTVIRKDGSEFILYVSNVDHKDQQFVTALKKHWQASP